MTALDVLRAALRGHLSPISVDALLHRHAGRYGEVESMSLHEREQLALGLEESVCLFSSTPRAELRKLIRTSLQLEAPPDTTLTAAVLSMPVHTEVDVNVARNGARKLALELGFGASTAVKIATCVSELARNIVLYAGSGVIHLEPLGEGTGQVLRVRSTDRGPGIARAQLESILAGHYRSRTGLGKGIVSVKRVAAAFSIESKPGAGTTITADFRARP